MNVVRIIYSIIFLSYFVFLLACEQRENSEIASVKTGQYRDITSRSAILEAQVNNVGVGIEDHGHCWGTSPDPTIDDNKKSAGPISGATSYTSEIDSLQPGTTYYYRAYVKSNGNINYGNSLQFQTLSGLADVITLDVTYITINSATSGGNITDNGGDEVISMGICWDKKQSFYLDDCIGYTEDGAKTGTYTSVMDGLDKGSVYFVKAYAETTFGISYGDTISFSTSTGVLIISTSEITKINSNSAQGGGVISDNGGSEIESRGICWNTTGEPSVSNSKTLDGIGTGSFASSMTGLIENERYYVRAYAKNDSGTYYGKVQSFFAMDPLDDEDGNEYKLFKAGEQVWMAENLKVTVYPDMSSVIPHVTDNTAWANLEDIDTQAAYCYYNNNANNEADTYGALYTWAAAKDICPTGWHLPSDAEWKQLEIFLGMSQAEADAFEARGTDEGVKLKSTTGWDSDNATNASGFTGLPSGGRSHGSGSFINLGQHGYWWSSTTDNSSNALFRGLYYSINNVGRKSINKSAGMSVRCVRD